ncbi:HEAT repeat domain-containing protein [candidate division KSB1 bacterium]
MTYPVKYRSILLFILIISLALVVSGCRPSALKKLRQSEYAYNQGQTHTINEIIDALNRNNELSRDAAIALGRLGDPEALPHLFKAIENNNIASREAVMAVGMLNDIRAVPVLIQMVKNNHRNALEAVGVLGKFKDKRAVPVLMQAVDEHRPYFMQAIEALGEIGDKSAVDLLMRELMSIPEEEPEDIKFRIIRDRPGQEAPPHVLTFDFEQNLAPKIEITEKMIQPEGHIFFRYTVKDTEYDTLALRPEFSVTNGSTWHPASTEGRINEITESHYSGSLIWRADLDNIPREPETQLIFKLTPTDNRQNPRLGIPAIIPFAIDTAEIGIKPVNREIAGEIELGFQYLNSEKALVDSFQYHYTLDNGLSWSSADIRQGIGPDEASEDTLWVIWSTEADLPHQDLDSVRFRISSNKYNTLGTYDITDPLHVDNNDIPEVKFLDFNDSDLFRVGYQLSDAENDNIALSLYYSFDAGRSWRQATVSGDISNLDPSEYTGEIRWYADFDITDIRTRPLRLRLRPTDNDAGLFTDSEDFYLKDFNYTKLTQGLGSGLVEIQFPVSHSDTTRPVGQYSLDRGRTWRNATLTDVSVERKPDKSNVIVNWDIGTDIATQFKQIEAIGSTLDKIKEPSVIPTLLELIKQKNHPSRIVRKRAIQASRLIEKLAPWVVEGLVMSLVHEDSNIREESLARLRPIDTPEVRQAVADYEQYWASFPRFTVETRAELSEDAEQEYQHSLNSVKMPTQNEMLEFIMRKGMTRERAEQFIKDLDIVRRQTKLREDYETGRISMREYRTQLEAIIQEKIARMKGGD